MTSIVISVVSVWFDAYSTGSTGRFSSALHVHSWMTWLKTCCFLVPVFSQPLICYFSCLLILKISCSKDRSTLCAAFNKSGPKRLNSSEAHKVSCTADCVLVYKQ